MREPQLPALAVHVLADEISAAASGEGPQEVHVDRVRAGILVERLKAMRADDPDRFDASDFPALLRACEEMIADA